MKALYLVVYLLIYCQVSAQWEPIKFSSNFYIAYNNTLNLLGGKTKKSYDSGISWNEIGDFNYIEYNKYAFLAGNDSIIMIPSLSDYVSVSIDGGRTFFEKNLIELQSEIIKSISLSDYKFTVAPVQNMAVIISFSKKVMFSFDDGKNWEYNTYDFFENILPDSSLTYILERDMSNLTSNFTESTLFVGGFKGIFKLIKHPITFDSVFYPTHQNMPDLVKGLNNISLAGNDKHLYAIMTRGSHVGNPLTYLVKSNDLGESWDLIDMKKHDLDTLKKVFVCGDFVYVTAKNRGLLKSSDQGKSWEKISTFLKDGKLEEFKEPEWLQFGSDFAVILNDGNIYKAPLVNCEIIGGVNSIETYNEIKSKIYPNPANDKITISGIDFGRIEIYNGFGQMLIQSEIQGNSTINTSNLQNGIYIVKIASNYEVKFEKLVISK